ncbi:MAG TPA: TonB-dependent receptor [Bryobacteraceae bacterium]|nr:TonB-dependent receptor [Bryobacteraceae bacterium]
MFRRISYSGFLAAILFSAAIPAFAQSVGNAGTVDGSVVDPSGAVVAGATVRIENAVSGYRQEVTSGAQGVFRLVNIPPNSYHLEVKAKGFDTFTQDLSVRNALPIQIKAALSLAGATTAVTVEGMGSDVLETDPAAHVDIDRSQILKLPVVDPAGNLSQAIVYSTGGVVADANGFFHPLGDHAQVTFVIDGQPVADQQSKLFSTQLPASAVQSIEAITGTPGAEFGDKSSLIAQVTTRSGLGAGRMFGSVDANYGTFGTGGGSVSLGNGGTKLGNFFTAEEIRSGRFLDTPELAAIHDRGNGSSLFDRIDYQPSGKDAFHLNLFAARNWFQIPNSYDQLAQDQKQRVMSWSVAPAYQHTFNSSTLLTVNPYVRKDQVNYYASRDVFNDTPATQSQNRQLMNWGVRADVAMSKGRHEVKFGTDLKQTRLLENFGFGVTDPTFNSPCLDNGNPVEDTTLRDPSQCAAAGFDPNTGNVNAPFSSGLLPYDLARGGSLLQFHAARNINQASFYAQDTIRMGGLTVNGGFRIDHYAGLVTDTAPEPRVGAAYNIKKTGTVIRGAYARTFETPFNENLLLSNATGVGGLAQNVFGANPVPVQPGRRNQFNAGLQQALGRYLLLDADYFWKYTNNGYDFSTLLNSTIAFPVAWSKSKLDGVTGRLSTININGFQAVWTFGHTRARYFPPETGGLIPQGAALGDGVFRIDHDQAFQSTLTGRYQHKTAEWVAVTYRYDSGQVVSGVPDTDAAMALTPNQEVSIGLACAGTFATVNNPITACPGQVTSTLISLPTPADANPDHNPARVKPRHIINLGFGTDNLLHATEGTKRIRLSVSVANLYNQVALYNFLSTFSGTHFLQPRTVSVHAGFVW